MIKDLIAKGVGFSPGHVKFIVTHGLAIGVASPLPVWTAGGVVPVRYVVGETANVVPVETVGAWDIGVVPAREQVGPANVVPVREAASETPRVKILLVQ